MAKRNPFGSIEEMEARVREKMAEAAARPPSPSLPDGPGDLRARALRFARGDPFSMVTDVALKELCELIAFDADDGLEAALKQEGTHPDVLGIQWLIREAAERVAQDVGEHGRRRRGSTRSPKKHYENLASAAGTKIRAFKQGGSSSDAESAFPR
jgi:hypothetical protein